MRVTVIGAGLGGMAAAIRLAAAGVEVDVFERSPVSGGKAAAICRDGYRFDTGPSLLTMPFVFRRLFEDAGAALEDWLDLVPLQPLATNFFPDGSVLRAFSDPQRFAESMSDASSPDSAAALLRFLSHARRLYETAAPRFLFQDIHEALRRRAFRLADLGALLHLDAGRSLHRAHASFFRDPRLVQVFDRYATFNGSDPYRAPATLAIIAGVEHGFGGFTVRGGIIQVPQAFEALARRLGVRFHFRTPVDRILVAGGRARGVVVGGSPVESDAVVTNADVRATYRDLLPEVRDGLARRYERLEPSTSGVVFLWGVRAELPQLSVSNLFFPSDYRAEFTDLFRRRTCPRDPTVFVNVTSKVNPGDAPRGAENWFVMVNAPADTGQDWNAEAASVRTRVLSRVSRALGTDVGRLIECETVLTPRDIEARTGSVQGCLYGISSNSRLSAFHRHPNRHPRIRGLYFCGGSAHPGGGMPLVTLSGTIAADLLLRHERAAGAP